MERLFFRGSTALFKPRPKRLGTVQHFCSSGLQKCCTAPKFLCPGTKNLRTVQHFCSPEGQKCCTVPKNFWPGVEKCCTVPKKPILQNFQGLLGLKVLENRFFRFFRDSTALFNEKPKKLGTVQHFCNPEEQKCCTVPKFLRLGTKNLGTVQHFCNPGWQKCCTVPKIFGLGLKSAVLSLKNLKNLFSRTIRASQA